MNMIKVVCVFKGYVKGGGPILSEACTFFLDFIVKYNLFLVLFHFY